MTPICQINTPWGEATVFRTSYATTQTLAIMARITETGEPLGKLSVNLAHGQARQSKDLPSDCFYAKDWQENEALARECLASGWFEIDFDQPPGVSGFNVYDVWRLRKEKGEPFAYPGEDDGSV